MTTAPQSPPETSDDLERSGNLIDLVSGWYLLAEEAHHAIEQFCASARRIDIAGLAGLADPGRVYISADPDAWRAVEHIAQRPRPAEPIAPIREGEET